MPREFSVIVSIDAKRARTGGRQFKRGADDVVRSSRRMTNSMNRSRKSATALITTIGRIRGVATLAFAGFLGVGGLGSIVKTIAQFEKGMKRVEALLGDRAVGGAMTALTEKARELGATTVFTATQAAEGMGFLTLAGFEALETFQAIGPALQLAQAGMLGLGEASDIVSNIMQGFNVEADETQRVVDVLAFVATRSNTSIRQLGEAMKFVAPVAGAVGLSVEQTAAALGLLGNSGLQASLAGTSLRRVLSGLLNPSKEATKVLADLGLESEDLVAALSDPTKGLTFVIKQLKEQGIGAAQAFTLFGQRGAPGLLSLIGQTDDLRIFNEQLKDVAGTARTIGEVMIDNLAGDARIAISVLQEAIIRLGESGLREWLRDVTQAFAGFIRGISDQEQAIEGATEKVMSWNRAGIALRENLGLIRKSLIVLVAFMSRAFIFSIGKIVVGLALWAFNAIKVVAGIRSMIQVAILLTIHMKVLRAAIISTGVGALAVAIGFLVDWVFFSKDAANTNDELAASMERLRSTVENQAFKWKTLTTEARNFAIIDLQTLLDHETDALIRQTRQLENATKANKRITQAKKDLLVADELANQMSERTFQTKEGAVTILVKNAEGLRLVEAATSDLSMANAFLATTSGITAQALEEQKATVERLKLRLAGYEAIQAGVVDTMKEYLMMINNIKDANDILAEGLQKDLGLTAKQTIALQTLVDQYNKNQIKIAKLKDEYDLLSLAMKRTDDVEAGLGKETGSLIRTQEGLLFAIRKLQFALSPAAKALETVRDKIAKLKAGTDKVKLATVQHEIAQRNLTREMIIARLPAEEMVEALAALDAQHKTNIETLKAACDETEELEKCMSDSAKAMQSVWDQALRNIQDSFADAFRGAFDSFEEFADKLLDAFKDLIANMLAQAAILNIFGKGDGFFNDFFAGLSGGAKISGVSTAAGTVAGTTAGAGASGTVLTNAVAAFTVGAIAFFQGATALIGVGSGAASATALGISGTGIGGIGTSGSAIAGAGGSTSAVAGNVLAGAGIGLISGAIADAILGSRGDSTRTSIFSAIGGAVGAFVGGPIGAIIGGAIGSFVSNLFGGARALESAILELDIVADQFFGTQTTITSKQKSFFRGRRFTTTTENVSGTLSALEDIFSDFASILEEGAARLGGDATGFLDDFVASATINLVGKTSAQIAAELEAFLERTMLRAIDEFLKDVTGLEDHIQRTLESFSDNLEEFVIVLGLLGSLEGLFGIDLLQEAENAIEEANLGVFEAYTRSLGGYRELIAAYDGSLTSLQVLTDATAVMIQIQLDLIAIYKQTGAAISELFQGSAQTIRESLLTEEELFNLRKSQIDELIEKASLTTDPEELNKLAQEINRLGLDAFNILDEDQRIALGPEFIEFFEMLDTLFGGQIDTGISDILADQAALDEEVSNRMLVAAEALLEAARLLAQQERDRELDDFFPHRGEFHA